MPCHCAVCAVSTMPCHCHGYCAVCAVSTMPCYCHGYCGRVPSLYYAVLLPWLLRPCAVSLLCRVAAMVTTAVCCLHYAGRRVTEHPPSVVQGHHRRPCVRRDITRQLRPEPCAATDNHVGLLGWLMREECHIYTKFSLPAGPEQWDLRVCCCFIMVVFFVFIYACFILSAWLVLSVEASSRCPPSQPSLGSEGPQRPWSIRGLGRSARP
jgi:hypothetical protein